MVVSTRALLPAARRTVQRAASVEPSRVAVSTTGSLVRAGCDRDRATRDAYRPLGWAASAPRPGRENQTDASNVGRILLTAALDEADVQRPRKSRPEA